MELTRSSQIANFDNMKKHEKAWILYTDRFSLLSRPPGFLSDLAS